MKVGIRADATVEKGTGHLMRCLALAHDLREIGAEITFYCLEDPKVRFSDRILAAGYRYQPLADLSAGAFARATEGAHLDWLIIDHYDLNREWEHAAASHARFILVIDDAQRTHHCADLLLDQNFYADSPGYELSEVKATLMGPGFALLRPEFRKFRNAPRAGASDILRIFAFFGGTDPTGESLKALRAMRKLLGKPFQMDLIVGSGVMAKAQLQEEAKSLPAVSLIPANDEIAHWMQKNDIALGAGGTTTWERACLGVPSLVISVAGNQEKIAAALDTTGIHTYLGKSDQVSESQIATAIESLGRDPARRKRFHDESRALVDGKGGLRVALRMGTTCLRFEPAQLSDSRAVYEWRTHPSVTQFSLDSRVFSYEEHESWLKKTIVDPEKILWIALLGNVPLGVIRYDLEATEAEVSIYLTAERQGKGWGEILLAESTKKLRKQAPGLRRVKAVIKPENVPSVRSFTRAGYRPIGDAYFHELHPMGSDDA